MKKVLVTGATGFIGRHCLPFLVNHGFDVHGVYWKQVPQGFKNIEFHRSNFLVPQQISRVLNSVRPTHLLHLAWYAVPGLYWTSEENHKWLEASDYLMQEFQSQGGQRLVVAGTCAEYDWTLKKDKFDEATSLAPTTVYGQAKCLLEAHAESLRMLKDLSTACGRIFMLYGPHEYANRLVAGIIRGLLRHQNVPCSHAEQVRDFLYVKDVASAFVALLESSVTGAVNIASGEGMRLKDIIQQIAIRLDGESLIRYGERPASMEDPQTLVADVRRLRTEVGWLPAYSLAQGLTETIDWWVENLALSVPKL